MDPNGNIYQAPEGEIPFEDKARLDGYLRAVEDQEQLDQIEERLRRLQAIRDSLA